MLLNSNSSCIYKPRRIHDRNHWNPSRRFHHLQEFGVHIYFGFSWSIIQSHLTNHLSIRHFPMDFWRKQAWCYQLWQTSEYCRHALERYQYLTSPCLHQDVQDFQLQRKYHLIAKHKASHKVWLRLLICQSQSFQEFHSSTQREQDQPFLLEWAKMSHTSSHMPFQEALATSLFYLESSQMDNFHQQMASSHQWSPDLPFHCWRTWCRRHHIEAIRVRHARTWIGLWCVSCRGQRELRDNSNHQVSLVEYRLHQHHLWKSNISISCAYNGYLYKSHHFQINISIRPFLLGSGLWLQDQDSYPSV